MAGSRIPTALTIAGSDSGGGAGIQADLKTFHAFGVYGTSVVTAVTAQNTLGVYAVHVIPSETVRAQIRAVTEDLRPNALKSGMLATKDLVVVVGESIREAGLGNYVLDPVMVASSGNRLLEPDAETALARTLLPAATLVTPNLHEAALLTGKPVDSMDRMRAAARALVEMGAKAALVKGGHLTSEEIIDVLWDGREERTWRHSRLETRNTHGTGCTLSSAVAAGLACGRPLADAVGDAIDFVQRAIAAAPDLGRGHGPVSHFVPAPPHPATPAG